MKATFIVTFADRYSEDLDVLEACLKDGVDTFNFLCRADARLSDPERRSNEGVEQRGRRMSFAQVFARSRTRQ